MSPHNVNPLQWHQAIGIARQTCARVFRDGGTPADALKLLASPPTSGSHSGTKLSTPLPKCCAQPL